MLVLLAVSVLLSAALALVIAALAVRVITDDAQRAQRHDSFCAYLAGQQHVEQAHRALRPLAANTALVYAREGCAG